MDIYWVYTVFFISFITVPLYSTDNPTIVFNYLSPHVLLLLAHINIHSYSHMHKRAERARERERERDRQTDRQTDRETDR